MVWAAYKKVRSNQGSAGVDDVSMEELDAHKTKHLYKLWNRMSSGSYFPLAVKEVEIPKKDGKIRKLGIPTISDRVVQMAVKDYLESRFEKIFSTNYYGRYRGYELTRVSRLFEMRLIRWARKRYKRYRTSLNKCYRWLTRIRKQFPSLFYHWQLGYSW